MLFTEPLTEIFHKPINIQHLFQVFLKARILDQLEEMRDERLSKFFTLFQARARGKLMRIRYQNILEKRYYHTLTPRAKMYSKSYGFISNNRPSHELLSLLGLGLNNFLVLEYPKHKEQSASPLPSAPYPAKWTLIHYVCELEPFLWEGFFRNVTDWR